MTKREMDKESPSLRPHGDVLKTPGDDSQRAMPRAATTGDDAGKSSGAGHEQPPRGQPRGDEPTNDETVAGNGEQTSDDARQAPRIQPRGDEPTNS